MITPSSKTIDGMEFELSPLPAFRGLEMFPRIAGLFSPVLEQLGSQKDRDAVLKGIGGLLRTDPRELVTLTKQLLETATVVVDGKKQHLLPVFDVLLQGKILTVFKLLAWALEVNYLDFFGLLKGAANRASGQMADLLKSFGTSGPVTG